MLSLLITDYWLDRLYRERCESAMNPEGGARLWVAVGTDERRLLAKSSTVERNGESNTLWLGLEVQG